MQICRLCANRLRQFGLALILICHSSFRGILEMLEAVLDYRSFSLGTIHNIVSEALQKAQQVNNTQAHSGIRVGAHDEIFQASKPVLVSMDTRTTYCYLLAIEDQRDETTWGVHLLDLADQGLHPDYTIADSGRGLRLDKPLSGKMCLVIATCSMSGGILESLPLFLENRAVGCTTMLLKLERKMQRAKNKGKGRSLSRKLAQGSQGTGRGSPPGRRSPHSG
jgi:hypothetical protein